MLKFNARYIVALEVFLCFALPTYFLFWGLVTLPVWLIGASSGAGYAAIHALSTIGGVLGLWALLRTLRYYVSARAIRAPNWRLTILLMTAGIASIWTEMTGQFAGFELDWFSLISVIAPTLCSIHVLFLAIHKSRRPSASPEGPNNSLRAAHEDARA
jgi:hypothetical protein